METEKELPPRATTPLPSESEPLTRQELSVAAMHKRLTLIHKELSNGFKFISNYDKSVSIFGSARFKENNQHYIQAQALAKKLAMSGFTIVTGAGPGIMEAANRGAMEVDPKKSVGLNIILPIPQPENRFVGDYMDFFYFFSRKVMMSLGADAYIYFPGGFGTLDEFFEIITLVQTKKIRKVPIILVGDDYWKPLDKFIKNELILKHGAIREDEAALYAIMENDEEIVRIVEQSWDGRITNEYKGQV